MQVGKICIAAINFLRLIPQTFRWAISIYHSLKNGAETCTRKEGSAFVSASVLIEFQIAKHVFGLMLLLKLLCIVLFLCHNTNSTSYLFTAIPISRFKCFQIRLMVFFPLNGQNHNNFPVGFRNS